MWPLGQTTRGEKQEHVIKLQSSCVVSYPLSICHLTASPGWFLQSLEPQFAFRVERHHHLVLTQDLQTEGEMPHANLVTPRRPGEGDRVLRLSLHAHPATW